jgi:type II secretory pathway pseudopilin PulG
MIGTWFPHGGPAGRNGRGLAEAASGFSLAETLVALGVAVSLVATLFPVYWQAIRGTLVAHDQSVGTMIASQRLEQLRSLTYRFAESGGGVWVRTTDLTTDLSGDAPSAGGSGLAPSPATSLLVAAPGFVDYLDSGGRWVGGGPEPPGNAAFVRRWAITPLASAPDDVIVVQVLVAPLAAEVREGPRVDAARRPGDVWLTLLRVRAS